LTISPKAAAATLAPLVVAVFLYLITGDSSVLYLALGSPIAGGAAVAAPPAPGVSQEEVVELAEQKRDRPLG
jgi:hypothetical protein